MRVAILIDRFAVDELHREVGKPAGGDAAVDEASDAGVLEQRENATLLDESPDDPRRVLLDELQRDALLELAVRPFAEVDATHPAATDLADDAKRPNAIGKRACERGGRFQNRRGNGDGGRFQEAVRVMVRSQKLVYFRAQRIVSLARAVDEARLALCGKIDDGIEDGVDAPKPLGW